MFWYQKIVLNTDPADAGYTRWMQLAQEMLAHMKDIYGLADMPYPYPIPDIVYVIQKYLNRRRSINIAMQQYRKKLRLTEQEWNNLEGLTDEHILALFVSTLEYTWRRRSYTVASMNKYVLNAVRSTRTPTIQPADSLYQNKESVDRYNMRLLRSKIEEVLKLIQYIRDTLLVATPQAIPPQQDTQPVDSAQQSDLAQQSADSAQKDVEQHVEEQPKTPSKANKSAGKSKKNTATKAVPEHQKVAKNKPQDLAIPVPVPDKLTSIASLYLPVESVTAYMPNTAKNVRIVKLLATCKQLCERYAVTPKTAITSRHGRLTLYPAWLLYEAYKACNVKI